MHHFRARIADVDYRTLTTAARAQGLSVPTLRYRIKQGMTPDTAVAAALGPTSGWTGVIEGETFPTEHRAAKSLAERLGISREKARDRVRRNIPTALWAPK